jgi:hypothetical protein
MAALAAYHADHDDYPTTLAALVPTYIDALPDDLPTQEPFAYERLSTETYTLTPSVRLAELERQLWQARGEEPPSEWESGFAGWYTIRRPEGQ